MSRTSGKFIFPALLFLVLVAAGSGAALWHFGLLDEEAVAPLVRDEPGTLPGAKAKPSPQQASSEAAPSPAPPAAGREQPDDPAPEALAVSALPVPSTASAPAEAPVVAEPSVSAVAPQAQAAAPATVPPALPQDKEPDRFSAWSRARAELAMLRHTADARELMLRIKKADDALNESAVVDLPDLRLPEMSAPPPPGPQVVSVRGVDGALSASIRVGGRVVVVRAGQSFNGGIIADISRSGVTVRRGKTVTTLPFE